MKHDFVQAFVDAVADVESEVLCFDPHTEEEDDMYGVVLAFVKQEENA